jgi:hypothetical protein
VTCDLLIKKFGHTLSHVFEFTLRDCVGTEGVMHVCVGVRASALARSLARVSLIFQILSLFYPRSTTQPYSHI